MKKSKIAWAKTITVKVDEENPPSVEILAQAIIDVSDAFEKINNSRLSRKAIVLLIQDAIGRDRITQAAIADVLDNAARLKTLYIK